MSGILIGQVSPFALLPYVVGQLILIQRSMQEGGLPVHVYNII